MKEKKHKTSECPGVHRSGKDTPAAKWIAQLRRDNIIYSGTFLTELEAADAYQKASTSDDPRQFLSDLPLLLKIGNVTL